MKLKFYGEIQTVQLSRERWTENKSEYSIKNERTIGGLSIDLIAHKFRHVFTFIYIHIHFFLYKVSAMQQEDFIRSLIPRVPRETLSPKSWVIKTHAYFFCLF